MQRQPSLSSTAPASNAPSQTMRNNNRNQREMDPSQRDAMKQFANNTYEFLFPDDPLQRLEQQRRLTMMSQVASQCRLMFSDEEIKLVIRAIAMQHADEFSPQTYSYVEFDRPRLSLRRRYTANHSHALSMSIISKLIALEVDEQQIQLLVQGIRRVPDEFFEITEQSDAVKKQRERMHTVFDLLDYIRTDKYVYAYLMAFARVKEFAFESAELSADFCLRLQTRAKMFFDPNREIEDDLDLRLTRAMGIALLRKSVKDNQAELDVDAEKDVDVKDSLSKLYNEELGTLKIAFDHDAEDQQAKQTQQDEMRDWCDFIFKRMFPGDASARLRAQADIQRWTECYNSSRYLFSTKMIKKAFRAVFVRDFNANYGELAASPLMYLPQVSLRDRYDANRAHKPSFDVLIKIASATDIVIIRNLIKQGLRTLSDEFWSTTEVSDDVDRQRNATEQMCDLIDWIREDDDILRQMTQVNINNAMQFDNSAQREQFLNSILTRARAFIAPNFIGLSTLQRYYYLEKLRRIASAPSIGLQSYAANAQSSTQMEAMSDLPPPRSAFDVLASTDLSEDQQERSLSGMNDTGMDRLMAASQQISPPNAAAAAAAATGNALDAQMQDAAPISIEQYNASAAEALRNATEVVNAARAKRRKWNKPRFLAAVESVLQTNPRVSKRHELYWRIANEYMRHTSDDPSQVISKSIQDLLRRQEFAPLRERLETYINQIKTPL